MATNKDQVILFCVRKGGSWQITQGHSRVDYNDWHLPTYAVNMGVRLVRRQSVLERLVEGLREVGDG